MMKSISLTSLFIIVCSVHVFGEAESDLAAAKPIDSERQKLHVAIYYESLCPDSIRFFVNQLGPTYPHFKDHIDVELIPFGKSESFDHENRTEFSCQHGPAECSGNKVQSCTLKQLENRRDEQIKYAVCQMDLGGNVSEYTGRACADTVDVNWSNIEECVKGPIGVQLQLEAEQATHLIAKPYPSFIPTIVYDRVWNSAKQRRTLYDFQDVLCHELVPLANGEDLPAVCYSPNKET